MEERENAISSPAVQSMRILNSSPLFLNLHSTAAIGLQRIELGGFLPRSRGLALKLDSSRKSWPSRFLHLCAQGSSRKTIHQASEILTTDSSLVACDSSPLCFRHCDRSVCYRLFGSVSESTSSSQICVNTSYTLCYTLLLETPHCS